MPRATACPCIGGNGSNLLVKDGGIRAHDAVPTSFDISTPRPATGSISSHRAVGAAMTAPGQRRADAG
jgi:hypothetical protein